MRVRCFSQDRDIVHCKLNLVPVTWRLSPQLHTKHLSAVRLALILHRTYVSRISSEQTASTKKRALLDRRRTPSNTLPRYRRYHDVEGAVTMEINMMYNFEAEHPC